MQRTALRAAASAELWASYESDWVTHHMHFADLIEFINRGMYMSHVYQPVMLRALLDRGGRASRGDIARALLNEDRSQLEYYSEITRDMVGRVLCNRHVVKRDGANYELLDHDKLTPSQVKALKDACDRRLSDYVAQRGDLIWQHRRRSAGYLRGTLKYEVLKSAKYRCDLCGVSADERALEVDHIIPRNKGGTDEISNLQALCYSCNAKKRDRDDTDFRAVRAAYAAAPTPDCPFCSGDGRKPLLENSLAIVLDDRYPVTDRHLLVIPRRHTSDYFDLGTAEARACQRLLSEARTHLLSQDASISGFNVGINSGVTAGQTVMHCHIHLIPRRSGDSPNPRGGIRAVIPGKADYAPARSDSETEQPGT
jgi:diadenosine tetraphosphate (Ap4A) HIT family hydrolase/5-methylcytosine-specific restriction endonuclease McrA